MNFLTVLPLAVVMIAGTQLIVAVFLTSADRARAASLGYLAGAGLVVTVGVTVSWLLARTVRGLAGDATAAAGHVDHTGPAIDAAVLAVLLVLAVVVWLRRGRAGEPRWLGSIEHAGPGRALRLGVLLFLATPTDDLTMAAVGASVARHDLGWWHLLPFVLLTVGLLALPLLVVLLLGARATRVLATMREGAQRQAWLVDEVLIGLFALLTVVDLLRSG